MSAFACGRCDECDGGRGSAFCLHPCGTTPTGRCECGRVVVLDDWKARAEAYEHDRDVAMALSLERAEEARLAIARAEKAERTLVESQAREQELMAAVIEYRDAPAPVATAVGIQRRIDAVNRLNAALSAPQDTTALREFGLKVARRAITPSKRDQFGLLVGETAEAIVDAVLKGAE